MASVDTVRITQPGLPGGMLINQRDFDPKLHTLHAKESQSEKEIAAAVIPVVPGVPGVPGVPVAKVKKRAKGK